MSRGQPLLTEPAPPPWTPETGCNPDLGAASLFRIRLTRLRGAVSPRCETVCQEKAGGVRPAGVEGRCCPPTAGCLRGGVASQGRPVTGPRAEHTLGGAELKARTLLCSPGSKRSSSLTSPGN